MSPGKWSQTFLWTTWYRYRWLLPASAIALLIYWALNDGSELAGATLILACLGYGGYVLRSVYA
jgi:hypothetical protein